MHEAAFGLHTSEALTEAGKWETIFFQFFSVFWGFFVHSLDLLQLIIFIDYVKKKKSWYGTACSVFALARLACIRILGTACKSSHTHEWNLKMSRERLRSKLLLIICSDMIQKCIFGITRTLLISDICCSWLQHMNPNYFVICTALKRHK